MRNKLIFTTAFMAVVILAGCSPFGENSGSTPSPSVSASASTEASPLPPPFEAGWWYPPNVQDDGSINVEQPDGTLDALPVVGTTGETLQSANTTTDARTPATFKDIRANCGVDYLLQWNDLVKCVNKTHAQWYIDAVNDRAKYTGFSWDDIVKWANDPQLDSSTQLTIQVYGNGFTDTQARAIALQLVGDKTLVDKLQIVRHPTGFSNTRSLGHDKVGNFYDIRTMVRVSLSPVVYDEHGKVDGVRGDTGIYIDCLNVWWLVHQTCSGPCRPICPPGECLVGKTSVIPHPGTDETTDSGTGTKPVVTVSSSPEATPPVVITTPSPEPTPSQTPQSGINNGTVTD